jgi:hypothetical protein
VLITPQRRWRHLSYPSPILVSFGVDVALLDLHDTCTEGLHTATPADYDVIDFNMRTVDDVDVCLSWVASTPQYGAPYLLVIQANAPEVEVALREDPRWNAQLSPARFCVVFYGASFRHQLYDSLLAGDNVHDAYHTCWLARCLLQSGQWMERS